MAQFEFSPLADSVTVTYKCPHCGEENTESFSVPSPDFSAETHHDSETQEFYDAQCGNCDEMYNVIITNGFYGGFGEIEDVEEISKVDEEIPGEDDEYFDRLLFKETHSDTEKALDAIEPLPQEIKDNLYRILSKLTVFSFFIKLKAKWVMGSASPTKPYLIEAILHISFKKIEK